MIGAIIGRIIFPGRHRGQRMAFTKHVMCGDHRKFAKHAKIRGL